jgi:hypothetical protein
MDEFRADELMRVARLLVIAEDLQMSALDPRDRADAGSVLSTTSIFRESLRATVGPVPSHYRS